LPGRLKKRITRVTKTIITAKLTSSVTAVPVLAKVEELVLGGLAGVVVVLVPLCE